MGQAAAKQGDRIQATDTHFVIVPGAPPTVLALQHAFDGRLAGGLSADVRIMGRPAATVDSSADNAPVHIPAPPGTAFQKPPSNRGSVLAGSPTVRINRKPAARHGDAARTCNDPADVPLGRVVASGSVRFG